MIEIEKVMSVYSGKPGCACGCRGKHTYRKVLQKEAGKNRGYEVSDSECNDRTVKMIVNKMNANPDTKPENNSYYFLDLGTRWYMAYLI